MKTLKTALISLIFATAIYGDDITNIYGRVFQNARVTRIEPDGISLTHAGGITKLFFPELPADLQAKYNYKPEAANAYSHAQSQAQQKFIAAQSKSAGIGAAPVNSDYPIRVFNILTIIDRPTKTISGLTGDFTDSFGHVFPRPVRGGKYRVTFDIRNTTANDVAAIVRYGDYYKQVFIPAGKTREREEISGPEKYYELFVELDGKSKGFTFNW